MEQTFAHKANNVFTFHDNAVNIDSLCRICSAPGSHSIFARIPAYCHEHYREYARWKQPIHLLLTEVTGIQVTQDDGLPKKICVLCISYLKHAYTFRRQTIDNIAGLLAAKYLSQTRPAQEKKIVDDHRREEIIPIDSYHHRSVNLSDAGHNTRKQTKKTAVMHRFVARQQKPPNNNAEEVVTHVEGLLGELDEPSSGLFGYREKEFVEDDVMDLEGLQEHGITFTLPEDYKEKKCFACRKRFMFTETYAQHQAECLLYKLTESIRALHHIMFLREQSAISAFEFIRRAVFTIRKCYRLVLSYDGELDGVDLPGGGEPVPAGAGGDEEEEEEEDVANGVLNLSSSGGAGDGTDGGGGGFLARAGLANFERIPAERFDSLSDSGSSGGAPPQAKLSLPPPHVFRFDGTMNNSASVPLLPMGPLHHHHQQYYNPPHHNHHLLPGESFAAAMASHSNVDIIKNRLTKTEAEEVNESMDQHRYKTIKCKQCESRFYTISHLDEHTKKVHQRPVGKTNNNRLVL